MRKPKKKSPQDSVFKMVAENKDDKEKIRMLKSEISQMKKEHSELFENAFAEMQKTPSKKSLFGVIRRKTGKKK